MTTLMFLAGFKPTVIGVISYCGLGYDTVGACYLQLEGRSKDWNSIFFPNIRAHLSEKVYMVS